VTEIGKRYAPDHALVSDARLAVEAVTEALEQRIGAVEPVFVDGQEYEARRIPHFPGKIHPGRLAQAIGRMLPDDAILLSDAGAHLAWLGYYVELEKGQNFRKTGAFGPMSAHVNGSIGVKLADPDRTVVVGCGDGCYSMAGFELMTAVQNDVPVIWVIFNDDEYKLVKVYQLATYGESGLVEFQNPDSRPTRRHAAPTATAWRRWRSSKTCLRPPSRQGGRPSSTRRSHGGLSRTTARRPREPSTASGRRSRSASERL